MQNEQIIEAVLKMNNKEENEIIKLKIEASNLDAKIKQIVTNSDTKAIVTASNLFNFLDLCFLILSPYIIF